VQRHPVVAAKPPGIPYIHFRFSPFRERKKGGILWEERRGKGKEKKKSKKVGHY